MAAFFIPLISLFLLPIGLQAKATNQLEAKAANQMSEELDRNLTNQNLSGGRIANVQNEEEGWAWMSDFSVDSWVSNWSTSHICH